MIYKEIIVENSIWTGFKPWRELLVWHNGDLIYRRWLDAAPQPYGYGKMLYNFVGE